MVAGIDPTEIIRKFKSELDERLQALSEGVLSLEADPDDAAALTLLFREAHTLKGTAKMLKLVDVNRIAHRMEDLFSLFGDKKLVFAGQHADLLLRCIDQLGVSLDAAAEGTTTEAEGGAVDRLYQELSEAISGEAREGAHAPQEPAAMDPGPQDLTAALDPLATNVDGGGLRRASAVSAAPDASAKPPDASAKPPDASAKPPDASALPPDASALPPDASPQPPDASAQPPAVVSSPAAGSQAAPIRPVATGSLSSSGPAGGTGATATIRVATDKLDRLVKLSSVLTTTMTHADTLLAELKSLKLRSRDALRACWVGPRGRANGGTADAVLAHILEQVPQLAAASTSLFRDYEAHTRELQQQVSHLAHLATDTRMVPVGMLFSGVQRAVRDLAREHGKPVRLMVEGEDTEVDKRVVDVLRGPMMHLIRNSIDHGIEDPDVRAEAGKVEEGSITLRAYHRGDFAIVSMEDDGKGLDACRLRAVAIERRLVTPEDAARLSDEECFYLIFLPGFSTSRMITDTSGRGMGLEAVKSCLDSLDGHISVESEPGRWTRVSLEIPLVLSIVRCLVFRVGRQLLALPTMSVERIIRFRRQDVQTVADASAVFVDEIAVSLVDAGQLFRGGASTAEESISIAVVVQEMGQRVAVPVDTVVIEDNLVISPLGPFFGDLKGVGGAAILGSGEVAIVLQSKGLFDMSGRFATQSDRPEGGIGARRVLVVDDSLNSRELVRSVLESAGHTVTVAVDGVDGLERARTEEFDLVVTDVEMPQMTGFELTRELRREVAYAHKPIIVMTTLDSAADKRRGLEAGASAYITKGSFDQESFLDTVERLIG